MVIAAAAATLCPEALAGSPPLQEVGAFVKAIVMGISVANLRLLVQ